MSDTTEKLNKLVATHEAKLKKIQAERKEIQNQLDKIAQLQVDRARELGGDKAAETYYKPAREKFKQEKSRLDTEEAGTKKLLDQATAARDKYVVEKKKLKELKDRDRAEYDRQKAALKESLGVQMENSRKTLNEKVQKLTRKKTDLDAKKLALNTERTAISTILGDKNITDDKALKAATKKGLKKECSTRAALQQYQKDCQGEYDKIAREGGEVKLRLMEAEKRQAEVQAAFDKIDQETARYDQARTNKLAPFATLDPAEQKQLLKEVADMDAAAKTNRENLLKTLGVEK